MYHQERVGNGETIAATKAKKTLSKENIKAQDTSRIGTEIENMYTKSFRSISKWSLV